MKYLSGVLLVFSFVFAQAQENGISRPDLPGDLMVDFGINVWSVVPDTLERKGFASKSVGIYYTKRYAISNKLSFYPGIGLGLEKLAFKNATSFRDSADFIYQLPHQEISKNKLAITYLDIPFDFRFHPKGTEDGEGFFVGIGGIFGVRMNAHTKWVYDDGNGKVRHKVGGGFNLESFRYGYQVRVGFKGAHFFYKSYLNDTFKSSFDGASPTMNTFGINLTGF